MKGFKPEKTMKGDFLTVLLTGKWEKMRAFVDTFPIYKAFAKFRFLDVKQVHALRRALRIEIQKDFFVIFQKAQSRNDCDITSALLI